MIKNLDPADLQKEVQLLLDLLDLRPCMVGKNISDEVLGFSKIVTYINKLHPQCIALYQKDTYKLKLFGSNITSYE